MLFFLTATFVKGLRYSDMSWKSILTPARDSGVVLSVGFGYAKLTPSGSVVWAKSVPTWRLDYIGTYPGGYFFTQDGSGFILSLIDENGNIVRSFTYSYPSFCGTNVQDVAWDGDGFVFLLKSCFSDLSAYRPALVKIDTLGNVMWAKRYPSLGPQTDALVKVGGRLFVAATDTSDTVIIFAMDGNGDPLWAKKMGFMRQMSYWGWRVMRLERIGTDVLFYLRTGSEPLVRLDTLGNVVWDRRLLYMNGYDLLVLGGHIYVGGWENVVKMDSAGNLIWKKKYATEWVASIYDITFADGHIYAYADPNFAADTLLLIKIDTATGYAPCSRDASVSAYDTTFSISSITPPAAENLTLSRSSGETAGSATVAVFNGCISTDISEGETPVPCESKKEIYDASGRRYRQLPDRPGIYFIRVRGRVRRVIRVR